MREVPIIFSAPMIGAIYAGAKTQTRRIVTVPWRGNRRAVPYEPTYVEDGGKLVVDCSEARDSRGPGDYREIATVMDRYGRVGDVLWVRETFCDDYGGDPAHPPESRTRYTVDDSVEGVLYKASHDCRNFEAGCPCNPEGDAKRSDWRSPFHMPRWASRLLLLVTAVRVERLQALSVSDAIAEGIDPAAPVKATINGQKSDLHVFGPDAAVRIYRMLWESLHGHKHPWNDNPWVWVVTVRRACLRCKGLGYVARAACEGFAGEPLRGIVEKECGACFGSGAPTEALRRTAT